MNFMILCLEIAVEEWEGNKRLVNKSCSILAMEANSIFRQLRKHIDSRYSLSLRVDFKVEIIHRSYLKQRSCSLSDKRNCTSKQLIRKGIERTNSSKFSVEGNRRSWRHLISEILFLRLFAFWIASESMSLSFHLNVDESIMTTTSSPLQLLIPFSLNSIRAEALKLVTQLLIIQLCLSHFCWFFYRNSIDSRKLFAPSLLLLPSMLKRTGCCCLILLTRTIRLSKEKSLDK